MKKMEKWHRNGQSHRSDGPSLIKWYKDGQKDCERYYVYNKRNIVKGPAIILWNNKNVKLCTFFCPHYKVDYRKSDKNINLAFKVYFLFKIG